MLRKKNDGDDLCLSKSGTTETISFMPALFKSAPDPELSIAGTLYGCNYSYKDSSIIMKKTYEIPKFYIFF